MQCAILSLGMCALAVTSQAAETNFLRSGLVHESDVKSLLSDELGTLGESTRSGVRQKLEDIRQRISTTYTSLPKNADGKLGHQAVRYVLHRFFVHRHGWYIGGLEPNNDTWHGPVDPDRHNSSAMKEWVPSYLQDILEQRLGQDGTDLDQISALAAALDDLIRKEARGRLETAYYMYEFPVDKLLTQDEADELILTYYVAFLNSGDFSAMNRKQAQDGTKDFISDYSGWAGAYQWLEDLKHKHLVARANGKYDFESIGHLLDKIGEEYFTINEADCEDLKVTLRKMQGQKPGRVRLSAFYNKGMYSHWDFSERREYLSSLGVLDETDPNHPSLIIANYAMARPNCLDGSNIYTICCRNECEDLMQKLESEIGSASAEPTRIAKLIASMPSTTVESGRSLSVDLLSKLDGIAARHDGLVPLHGRLFAQWMHHAYPLECMYPHEIGSAIPMSGNDWMKETGHQSEKASTAEIMEHIEKDSCSINTDGGVHCSEESTDLPWSDHEELLTSRPRSRPVARPAVVERRCPPCTAALACGVAIVGLLAAVRYRRRKVAWRPIGGLMLVALAAFGVGLLDGVLLIFVLGVGAVVVVANEMSTKPRRGDALESKHCV